MKVQQFAINLSGHRPSYLADVCKSMIDDGFRLIHPLCLSDAEEELLSLEEELTHFQRKIEKHDWIRNQVDDVESDVKEGWCD